ncbi:MAG: hypothetical protein JSS43_01235 [Proteobacteria bacterium]|nr:hypothetical protein [Pseudomonadota bacterium]
MHFVRFLLRRAAICVVPIAIVGCGSIGPTSMPRDRLDYLTAVAESWKEQTLLNIVRLRYGDAPSFLDVSSVISAYTFQGQLSAGGQLSSNLTNTIPRSFGTVGASAAYQDRPTISYTPLAGEKFARSLLTPLPPSEVFELIQAGYPADNVLLVTTRAINGVYNRTGVGARARDADPQFYELMDALRRLQLTGSVSLRLEKKGKDQIGLLVLSGQRSAATDEDLVTVRRILRVKPNDRGELQVGFGLLARGPNEISLLTRSMVEILLEVAAGIEVPPEHIVSGRTVASTRQSTADNPRDKPLIRIMAGPSLPNDVYSAVRYRGTWYWIDDNDLMSKRVFTFLMIFFSLAETGVTPQAPVLTVPAS